MPHCNHPRRVHRPARAAHQDGGPEEHISFILSGKAPGASGEVKVEWQGSSLSLTAKAMAALVLVVAACLAATVITMACKLAAVTALVIFPVVLVAGLVVTFRRDSAAVPPEVASAGGQRGSNIGGAR